MMNHIPREGLAKQSSAHNTRVKALRAVMGRMIQPLKGASAATCPAL